MGGHSQLPLQIPKLDVPQVSFRIVTPHSPSSYDPITIAPISDHSNKHLINFGYNPLNSWELPNSYIRWVQPSEDELDRRCEYDMDEQDQEWLDLINAERKKVGHDSVPLELFEIVMDRLEKEWFHLSRKIVKPDANLVTSEDSRCTICEDGDTENSNAIVFCDGCNLAVHQDCYGVPYIPEGQWLCRKCTVSPDRPVNCELCPNSYGAFKQTSENLWAHLVCAIHIPETGVGNPMYMEPIDGISCIPKQRWKLKCYICKKTTGACIQCANRTCCTAYHVTCAQESGLYLKIRPSSGQHPTSNGNAQLTDGPASEPQATDIVEQSQSFCDKHTPKGHIEALQCAAKARVATLAKETTNDPKPASPSPSSATCTEPCSSNSPKPHESRLLDVTPKQINSLKDLQELKLLATGSHSSKSARAYRKTYSSGPPLVPELIFQNVWEYCTKLRCAHKKIVINMICKYWSLKREVRRGAPLLKRLHLEPWTAASSTNPQNEEDRRRKYELLVGVRNDLQKVKHLTAMICKREQVKLRMSAIQKDVIEQALIPSYECMSRALTAIIDADKQKYFLHPVLAADVPDYHDIIKHPMDWSTMQRKLEAYEYLSLADFISDIQLTLTNARIYNHPSSPYHKAAVRVGKAIEPLIHELIALEPPSAISGSTSATFPNPQQQSHLLRLTSLLTPEVISNLLGARPCHFPVARKHSYAEVLEGRAAKRTKPNQPSSPTITFPPLPSNPQLCSAKHIVDNPAQRNPQVIAMKELDSQTPTSQKSSSTNKRTAGKPRPAPTQPKSTKVTGSDDQPHQNVSTPQVSSGTSRPDGLSPVRTSSLANDPEMIDVHFNLLGESNGPAEPPRAKVAPKQRSKGSTATSETGTVQGRKKKAPKASDSVTPEGRKKKPPKPVKTPEQLAEEAIIDQQNPHATRDQLRSLKLRALHARRIAERERDMTPAERARRARLREYTRQKRQEERAELGKTKLLIGNRDADLEVITRLCRSASQPENPKQAFQFAVHPQPAPEPPESESGMQSPVNELPRRKSEHDQPFADMKCEFQWPVGQISSETFATTNLIDPLDTGSSHINSTRSTEPMSGPSQDLPTSNMPSTSGLIALETTPIMETAQTFHPGTTTSSRDTRTKLRRPCLESQQMIHDVVVESDCTAVPSSQPQSDAPPDITIDQSVETSAAGDLALVGSSSVCGEMNETPTKSSLPVDSESGRPSDLVGLNDCTNLCLQSNSPMVLNSCSRASPSETLIAPEEKPAPNIICEAPEMSTKHNPTTPDQLTQIPVDSRPDSEPVRHEEPLTQLATSNLSSTGTSGVDEESTCIPSQVHQADPDSAKTPTKRRIKVKTLVSPRKSPGKVLTRECVDQSVSATSLPEPVPLVVGPKLRLVLDRSHDKPDDPTILVASTDAVEASSLNTGGEKQRPIGANSMKNESEKEKSKTKAGKVPGLVGVPEFVTDLPDDRDSFRLFNTGYILPEGTRRHTSTPSTSRLEPIGLGYASCRSSLEPSISPTMATRPGQARISDPGTRLASSSMKSPRSTRIHHPEDLEGKLSTVADLLPSETTQSLSVTTQSHLLGLSEETHRLPLNSIEDGSSELSDVTFSQSPDSTKHTKGISSDARTDDVAADSMENSKCGSLFENLNCIETSSSLRDEQSEQDAKHSNSARQSGSTKKAKRKTGPQEKDLEVDERGFYIYPKAVHGTSKHRIHPLARQAFTRLSETTRVPEEEAIPEGTQVWAKVPGHNWFPAEVGKESDPDVPPTVREKYLRSKSDKQLLVMFYDRQRSWQSVPRSHLRQLGESAELDALLASEAYVLNRSKLEEIQEGCQFARDNLALPEDVAAEDWALKQQKAGLAITTTELGEVSKISIEENASNLVKMDFKTDEIISEDRTT